MQFVIFKNMFSFSWWCHYTLTVTVSWCYVITQECWFHMHFIHAEDFSLSTKSNWCILHQGLKTIWDNFQPTASDSYFWKKQNDWVFKKTMTTNLNKNHMAYPTLFHAVGMQCLVSLSLSLYIYIYIYIYIRPKYHHSDNLNLGTFDFYLWSNTVIQLYYWYVYSWLVCLAFFFKWHINLCVI